MNNDQNITNNQNNNIPNTINTSPIDNNQNMDNNPSQNVQSEMNTSVEETPNNSQRNLNIMICSIVNLVTMFFFLSPLIHIIVAIVLIILSVKGIKQKDKKSTISLIFNIITIVIFIAIMVLSIFSVNRTIDNSKIRTMESNAISIMYSAEIRNKSEPLTGKVQCKDIVEAYTGFDECYLDYSKEEPTITATGGKGLEKYCIYDKTKATIKVEECK